VVVVGGGISGLAAAWRLSRLGAGVTVLEQSDRFGGKLWRGALGELEVDLGAESFLARRPEALQLVDELGLRPDLVHPVTAAATVLRDGVLHLLPADTVMGVPTRLAGLSGPAGQAGLLTEAEVARVAEEPSLPAPPLEQDVDVASWVQQRFGAAVLDRLVEPLLGGVYAGHARLLSLAATVPTVWDRARQGGPVLQPEPAEPSAAQPAAGRPEPVFAGLLGGIGRLPEELVAALRREGVRLATGCTVRELRRTPTGWQLTTGSAGSTGPAATVERADAVVLAVPPAAAARLLGQDCPVAATELAAIRTASVAVVATLLPRTTLAGLAGSGILVPPVEGRPVKAVTFSSAKWAWTDRLHPDLVVARMSLGRDGEVTVLQRDDAELIRLATDDLADLLGRAVQPAASRVVRWGGSLPQYDVGHLDRVRRIRAAVSALPGLAVCGAALDGVGIPACIGAADRAGREALVRRGTMAR
jgi:protoporphyrinogen/coproporphyrinogen III oxidase